MGRAIKNLVNNISKYDEKYCIQLNNFSKFRIIQAFFRFISWLGNGKIWYFIIILLPCIDIRLIYISFKMILIGLIGTGIYKFLKSKFNRPRPYKVNAKIKLNGEILDQFSFPSGHSLHAVIFSLVLIDFFPTFFFPLLVFTSLTALSRVILGMHYPTDVFVGIMLGFIIYYTANFIYTTYENTFFI
jgi:undecaprenyl-diphosphatase